MTLPVSPVPSAAESVRAAIAQAGGSIPFSRYMELALYGPGGFYSASGHAGRRGDFITSPEVGPLFGLVVSRAIDDVWRRCGSPDGFVIVDAGAGPGTLARSVTSAAPECLRAGRYVAVEASAAQRSMHPDNVESIAAMPEHVEHGVVIANELLDNLPFELWVADGEWKQAHVIDTPQGFNEILLPGTPSFPLPERAPLGTRAPVQHVAAEWLRSALGSLRNGSVIVIDYCTVRTVQVAAMAWREWLRTYVGHERGVHYLKNTGEQDITAQVLVDQLSAVAAPDAVRTQAQFLSYWGIEELVEEGRRVWRESASAPTLHAMRMRSRVSEAEALLDPAGLGAFSVLEWRV